MKSVVRSPYFIYVLLGILFLAGLVASWQLLRGFQEERRPLKQSSAINVQVDDGQFVTF